MVFKSYICILNTKESKEFPPMGGNLKTICGSTNFHPYRVRQVAAEGVKSVRDLHYKKIGVG